MCQFRAANGTRRYFTNDREKLPQALGHDVSHQSAHTPDLKPPQHEIAETPKQEKKSGSGYRAQPLKAPTTDAITALPETLRPSPPTPVAHTEQSKTPAAAQATLPLFDASADMPKEAFVWDESKGIE